MKTFKQRPPFFMVWNASSHETKHRHKTVEEAEKEAERLSLENPGYKFHVLMALGRCYNKKAVEKGSKEE